MTDLEYRVALDTWPAADLAIRAVDAEADDPLAGLRFSGYAAVFDSPSEPLPGKRGTFVETIAAGAFTKTLAERGGRVRMFWNHNTDIALASARAKGPYGTLNLAIDDIGLRAEAVFMPSDRAYADKVAAGVADSMSFGFNAVRDEWSGDGQQRRLTEIRLHEVSIVSSWPAYAATSATVRALAEEADTDPDTLAEAFRALRDPEGRLTTDQRRALVAAIDARSDLPVLTHVARWQERLAALA